MNELANRRFALTSFNIIHFHIQIFDSRRPIIELSDKLFLYFPQNFHLPLFQTLNLLIRIISDDLLDLINVKVEIR